MTTATATISPAATMFLLSSHHHRDHRGWVETPMPSLTPPPQSPEEAVAEVEAEVEQFRRQLYLRRGLSYPGPKTTIALPRQGAAVVARQQYSSSGLSGKIVGPLPVATAATIASTVGAVEHKTESSSSSSPSSPPLSSPSSSLSSSSSPSPSPSPSSSIPIPTSSGSSGDNNTRVPKTFSQLMEDLIRTHSSTASPSGQKYSTDLLHGTIGHYKDAMFGSGTYFGSFT